MQTSRTPTPPLLPFSCTHGQEQSGGLATWLSSIKVTNYSCPSTQTVVHPTSINLMKFCDIRYIAMHLLCTFKVYLTPWPNRIPSQGDCIVAKLGTN